MSDYLTEFPNHSGVVPYIDVKNVDKIPQETIDKFGSTDFRQVFQRNLEREYVMRQAALMSVAGQASIVQPADNLNVLVTASPVGGVEVKYPTGVDNYDTSEVSRLRDKKTQSFALDKVEVKYTIGPEAMIVGDGNMVNAEYIEEVNEQLAGKLDKTFIDSLKAKKHTANGVTAGSKWDADGGAPEEDIAEAIGNILKNSGVNPNPAGQAAMWSVILPIGAYHVLNKIRVIDSIKTTINEYIARKYNLQFLYTRAPLGESQYLTTEAIVIPTKDRKVGKLRTFDGAGRVPSTYSMQDANGIHVTANYWMKYINAPDEVDGDFTDNRRIAVISTIL